MKRFLPLIAASSAITLLAVLFLFQCHRAAEAEHALHETYLSALGESTERMERLTLSMEKALISRDAEQTAMLLGGIREDADVIHRSLAFLPLSHDALNSTMTLAHTLAEDAQRLTLLLIRNGSLSDDDRAALETHLHACVLLEGQLALAQQDVLNGRIAFSDTVQELAPTGHASAMLQLPDAKGLPRGVEVNQGQALTIAQEFVGVDRVTGLEPAPDVRNGVMPAWGVTIQTEDLQLNLEVTRIGGKVLLMSPETAGFPVRMTVEACIDAAQRFLNARAMTGMTPTWRQIYDGMCVITFVATQNDTLLYPDHITVQVRMDTAEVVGLEARSYWMNHTPRRLDAPAIHQEEARERLSPELTVQDVQLCVIPHDGEERLCWQFTADRGEETFLIYVDAETGRELALEKIVFLENGMTAA